MKKKNCILNLLLLMALSLVFLFGGCSVGNPDSSSGGGNKTNDGLTQDLSRFDSVQHYGVENKPKYTLTLATENASFSDGKKSLKLQENAMLPDIEWTGDGFIGGVKFQGEEKVYETYRFRMPAKDATIEIVKTDTKPTLFQNLSANIAFNGSVGPDYSSAGVKSVEARSPFVLDTNFSFKVKENNLADINGNGTEDYLRGSVFEITGSAGNFARLLTGCGTKDTEYGIVGGATYTFVYNFENKGEAPISFKVYQLQSGVVLSGSYMVAAGKTITLEKGESKSFCLEFTAKNSNDNIMPVFQLQSEADKALIGIAIGKMAGKLTHEHKIEKIAAQKAVCTGTGNSEYYGCETCGAMYSSESGEQRVTMLDVGVVGSHEYGEWQYEGEIHYRQCKVCSKKADKAEHIYRYVVTKEATETETGLKEELCTVCGKKTGKSEATGKLNPADKGEKIAYRLEAECAEFEYGAGSPESRVWTDEYNLRFGTGLSGYFATANMNKALGDKQIFRFESDKSLSKVTFKMRIGNYGDDVILGDYFTITVNGEEIDLSGIILGAKNSVTVDGNQWLRFSVEELLISLQKGDNEIVFEHIKSNSNIGNLDYIELYTSAVISGFDNERYKDKDSVWSVTKEPTAADSGVLTCTSGSGETEKTRNYNIPALAKGKDFYDYTKEGSVETYSLTIKGKEVLRKTLDSSNKYKLKIYGTTAIYELNVGAALPEGILGKDAAGWYNVDNIDESGTIAEFVMPERDITIAPLKKVEGTALDFCWKADSEKNVTFAQSTRVSTIVDGIKGREVTITPTAKGSCAIRFQSAFGSTKSVSGMTFYYTIENRSNATVKFSLNQVNSGTVVLAKSNTIELAAGKKIAVELTMPEGDYSNENALSYFVFTTEDTAPIKFAVALSYKEKKA